MLATGTEEFLAAGRAMRYVALEPSRLLERCGVQEQKAGKRQVRTGGTQVPWPA